VASLLEIVQRPALAVPAVPLPPADPAVRGRTLAQLRGLQQIPALQSLAKGFLQTLSQPQVAVEEVVESIRKDSALCVRLLRAANSAAVASEQRIEDLGTAVQMLGVLRVRKMMQAMFTLRDGHRVAAGFDWRHLWIHALATAAIAEELERRLRPMPDSQIHLAALLHDVGKIVLSTLAPDDYREVLLRAWNDGGPLEDLERAHLGVDHREAGVIFARHNGLPDVVVAAIEHHQAPARATEHRFEVALVGLANHLSKAHGLGFSGSRLGENDGDFAEQAAWEVVRATTGEPIEPDDLEKALGDFLATLRADLRSLRECV
jgi:putative nucleotidyltransferase with HDIG domain